MGTGASTRQHLKEGLHELYARVVSVEDIFQACDVDLSGALDLPESQYALRALGLYPTDLELEEQLKDLGLHFPLTSAASLQHVGRSLNASTCKRGLRASKMVTNSSSSLQNDEFIHPFSQISLRISN